MKQKHQSRRLAQILKELLVVSLLFNFQFSIFNSAWAQMKGGVPVKVSNKTQMVNGKRYFVHVVDQGQTVYAISRAYGLKEVEAITKKDIHFLQIGDTVWLPCKGQRLPDGTVAPPATGSAEPATDASMRNGQATSQQHTAVNTDVRQQQAERREPAQPETPLGPTAEIRQRVNPQSVVVSLMMPFNLSQMDKISTSKFDVEQRGKTVYKSLEFIQFYEGLLLGLEQLEKMGYNVVLNVVDVEENTNEASPCPQIYDSRNEKDANDFKFARKLTIDTYNHIDDVESMIKKHLQNWDFDRVALMDVLLINMAVTEFTCCPSIPERVTVDEYIELSKEFSTERSKLFINGILDKFIIELRSAGRINKSGRGLIDPTMLEEESE